MITQLQINNIVNVFKPYNPKRLGVFGSYARGENTTESDIDILYSFNASLSVFSLVKIKEQLENVLGRKVDLVSERYINEKLKKNIENDLKIIYES